MLKVKAIRDEPGDRRLFEIHGNGEPASAADVERVARVAARLVDENGIGGEFRGLPGGILELRLSPERRTFFHEGIVFAALDAVNDPVHSPTLTQMAADPSAPEGD